MWTRLAVTPRRVLLISFLLLLGFAAFFLVRPFLDGGSAYRPRPPGTAQAYSFVVVAAFVPYAGAVWATRRGISLWWAVAGTVVLHAVVLPAALVQSQDLYASLFYGKMWAVHGANPYVDLPLRFAADPWFAWVRWPGHPSVYGPVWTILAAGPAWASSGNVSVALALAKVVVAGLGAATVTGLARAARDRGIDPGLAVLLVGWNPLVILSLPLAGHADVAVTAALPWALVADRRRRPVLAALLLAGATLVKAYVGVVLIVYLVALARRSRAVAGRALAVSAGAAIAAWFPFWAGPETLSGVIRIGGRASSSLGGTIELALAAVVPASTAGLIERVAGLAVIVAVIVAVARREGFADDPWPGAAAAFAAYLLVTPWFLPWHLAGLLVLAAVAASPPLGAAAFTFSGTAPLTASFGGVWWGRVVQTALRYGLPAAAFSLESRRARAGTPRRWPRPRRSPAGTRAASAPETPTGPPPRSARRPPSPR
jgi:hypothetical protein